MLWIGQLLDCCINDVNSSQARVDFWCSSDIAVKVKAPAMVHCRTPLFGATLACCTSLSLLIVLQTVMQQLGAACLLCRADKELHAAAARLIATAAGADSADDCGVHAAQDALCQVLTNAVEVGHCTRQRCCQATNSSASIYSPHMAQLVPNNAAGQ